MTESMNRLPERSLKEVVRQKLEHYIVDAGNSFAALVMFLNNPVLWSDVPKAQTFKDYLESTYGSSPELVDAIYEATGEAFITAYDAHVRSINTSLENGILSEVDAVRVMNVVQEAIAFVREHASNLRP